MKTKWIVLLFKVLATLSLVTPAKAQFFVDCSCLATQAVLITNTCQAAVPDLCQFTNCWQTTVVPPPVLVCSQTPPVGTLVGLGRWPITLTIMDASGVAQQSCSLIFQVKPPANGCLTLLCATNKTVECGSTWTFNPPTWTNACVPPPGTPSNGVVVTIASTTTNGTCPQVITRTWKGVDDCGNMAQCSQTVTVVDTTPPQLSCTCLTNSAVVPPVPLTVIACASTIPDLCLPAMSCANDVCGVVGCSQSPPAGTGVGVGVHPITVTVYDCASNTASCMVNFTVIAPAGGCAFSLLCSSNKTVECGSTWTFNPPTWTNACVPPPGTPSNGVVLTITSTVTNGTCSMVITRTWRGMDDCGADASCSQTVTVVDTTPPVLNCTCLTNSAVNPPVPLTVIACTSSIPDLCLLATLCATDNCGPPTCRQSPPAGTPVGPGSYPITVTVIDCASNTASCVVYFTVIAPAGGCTRNPCAPPPSGMVAWWPLDEPNGATLFVDATGNGHTALVESSGPVGSPGSPFFASGKVAGAKYFYGLSPRGRALSAGLNVSTNSFSVDCWVNPVLTGPTFWHPIVDKLNQTSPTTGVGYALGLLNTNLVLKVGDGTIYTYTSLGSVSYAAWNFVAVVVDRVAKTVTFNINGLIEPAQSMASLLSFNSGLDLLIGSTYNGAIGLGELAVDELELFNRTLTTNEMNALWIADSFGKCKTNTCLLSLFCPSDIVTNRSCTQTCAIVTYPAPFVTNGVLVSSTPPSGSCFALGTTIVTCTATNACGQSAVCSFTITVNPGTNCLPCDFTLAHRLYSGTTAGGAVLPTGAPEPLWVNTAAPFGPTPMVVVDTTLWPINGGPWLAPSAQSAWVGPNPSAQGPVGWYTNRWTFDAPCTNVCLRGRFATDDDGYLYINGTLVAGPSAFVAWTPVSVCGGFSLGPNTLELVVHNAGGPTGFRTELEIWTQCCNPCPSQTNIWNTGMGGASGNVPLGGGTPDPKYTLVSAPPGGCTGPAQVLLPSSLPVPPWIANGPNSQWIGAGPTANCQGGVYHYRLCFYLPCTDGASIIGQWTADDWAHMYFNGLPTGNTVPSTQFPNISFGGWHPVSITNGFVCGNNCLDFYVTNAWTFDNPTGLRAQLTNVWNNCCCQPAQTVFSVFSGQVAAGPLPVGTPDTQFALTCAPPGVSVTTPVVVQPSGYWLPNGPSSQWIGPAPSNVGPGGVYCYTLNFNLPPCTSGNPTYSVTGRWMGDDAGTIYLNGNPTGVSLPVGWAFTNWHPISITSGLVPGLNTLTFYATNAGAGPTGLRLELTGSASCCACDRQPCSCSLTNGNFSQPVPANGTGGGWTSSGGIGFGYSGWQASGGNPGGTFLLNNVGDPATDPTVSQTICCLVPGQCYTIRGQRKVQAWYGQTAPSFAVLVDGAPILTLSVPTNPADNNWHDFSVSFTATNTCQTIGFAAEINGTDVSYWIDNIRLECCNPNCHVSITCPPNLVLLTCGSSAVGYYNVTTSGNSGPVICTPPSGTTFPMGSTVVICTATNTCGDAATCSFTVTVKPPPNRWACIQLGIGIPFELVGGATAAMRPEGEMGDPAVCIFPDPASPASGVLFQPGNAQAITFTTELPFDAPDGALLQLTLPPGPGNSNGTALLSCQYTCRPRCGWNIKVNKKFADDPSGSFRTIAVNTNGQLLNSFTFTSAEAETNDLLVISGQPGVSNCHVTVELNLQDGSTSLEFAGPVAPSSQRKGWDGLIYGPDRPVKKPSSRVIITPPGSPGQPPITEVYLLASGMAEVTVENPSLTATGRKWGDGHVTLMKAYDDGDSVEFVATDDGGGVQVDLGNTESFNLRLTNFGPAPLIGEDLLTRTLGPIRGLTNRPPPPFIDALLLHSTASGVECSADFSNIDSATAHILIYNGGSLVAERIGVPAQLGQPLFTLPGWPATLGKLGGATPNRRGTFAPGLITLPAGGPVPPQTVSGDEFRVLAEPPPGTALPDYCTGFEFIVSDGADWGISQLQRTLACSPVPLHLERSSNGLIITWSGDGFRLQGAEKVTGPWYDLGVSSPVVMPETATLRFLRLVCN